MMTIETVVVGELDTNCYVLKRDNFCIVIDPGDDYEKIKNVIGNCKLLGVIITHYHFDHIGALKMIKNDYHVKIYDYSNLVDGYNKIGTFEFEKISTPGHKDDLIAIYFKEENILFCGDFIFKGGIGRYDFPDSSFEDMKKSIKKILSYPYDMIIFPGHGPKTDLQSEEDILNYYLDL